MAQEVSGRALREPALVADATGAASVSAHAGDGQARWDFQGALAQLEYCQFQCEAGPLENNQAFIFLSKMAEDGPAYFVGQAVWFCVETSVARVDLAAWAMFTVVAVKMSADSTRNTFEYDLSRDPIRPWHYGSIDFQNIPESKIRLCRPSDAGRLT